ncbi:response regulator transcription factor [Anaerocolumna chitinilytica]|uniref:Stage 0 sporulation protein A homolog n=1 Tax=Anaerocolumna chitinilytica TaxID=1727145 RepID=A0A7I8DLX9_9FIRM|nr:response regulator transcription factor [Anaerocolumna chitinilytica]BCJ99418.1 DNA-binding response regulator [Anaerocolumna chitinilytica]
MYNILIVEDDITIASLVKENLMKWGFQAKTIKDLNKVLSEVLESKPHLILLDISLPFYNGFYWCSEIRKKSKVPIIFLTSHTENMDLVMAMNMGGDDYITKPFSMDVLIVKIQALLRRAYDYYVESKTLEVQGVSLNLADTSLNVMGKETELTKNEYKIMKILMENKNRVVLREEIMEALWDSDYFVDDNTLTVNVNRLRKKLEDMGLKDFIQTKKGMGYLIHEEVLH